VNSYEPFNRDDIDQTLRNIKNEPTRLGQLTPRQFEQIVAALLVRLGYEVQVTSQTRDAGIDMFVIHHDPIGKSAFAVECKYYASGRPVGVAPVRALSAVKEINDANRAILVTNTRFPEEAKEFASRDQDIQHVDSDELLEWLKKAAPPQHIAESLRLSVAAFL
jgi:restriction system protein